MKKFNLKKNKYIKPDLIIISYWFYDNKHQMQSTFNMENIPNVPFIKCQMEDVNKHWCLYTLSLPRESGVSHYHKAIHDDDSRGQKDILDVIKSMLDLENSIRRR